MLNPVPKKELRQTVKAKINSLPDKSRRSEAVWHFLVETPDFTKAVSDKCLIMVYLNMPGEVETTRLIFDHFTNDPVIPYCVTGEVELFRLKSFTEIEPQTLGIMEPRMELRTDPTRRVEPNDLGLVLVPGLAFDLQGNRLGRGAGYYDRFFTRLPSDVPKIALAFDCQIVDLVPTDPHDMPVDMIITETGIHRPAQLGH